MTSLQRCPPPSSSTTQDPPQGLSMPSLEPLHAIDISVLILEGFSIGHPVLYPLTAFWKSLHRVSNEKVSKHSKTMVNNRRMSQMLQVKTFRQFFRLRTYSQFPRVIASSYKVLLQNISNQNLPKGLSLSFKHPFSQFTLML